jgi:hypothetical protein
MDNKWSIIFEYFGNFNYFISHAISICSKSISHDCGNTNHGNLWEWAIALHGRDTRPFWQLTMR